MKFDIPARLRGCALAIVLMLSVGFTVFIHSTSGVSATEHELETYERTKMEEIVREYLLENPEIVRDALLELERRNLVAETKLQQQAIAQYSEQLLGSPSDFVAGNPDGDVTMVEFFDYNCSFCRRALADLDRLLEDDPNLRVVLKEFPVLGQGSLEAAKYSIAVLKQGKYLDFHKAVYQVRGGVNAEKAVEVATELGLDIEQLHLDANRPETVAIISQNVEMANALGINGTPSYVIGGQLVVGAVGYDELAARISAERERLKSDSGD